ncbi:MAG: hypothetical protein M1813_004603 [Trichoglossum hirsutum]|nr:MAG: hypothetical protein M1813_004603 [Trichoglossum hirsutum]
MENSSGNAGDGGQLTPFGAEMRRKHFLFDKDYVNLNHVRKHLRAFQDASEARPDPFIRHDAPIHLDASRELLAQLLHAPTSEIVLVPNATTGINTVLRSLTYTRGDAIIYFSNIYGSCEKTIVYLCETTPVRAERIEIIYPAEDAAVVDVLRAKLKELARVGRRPRVVVFDTVVSMPGVRMPFEELTKVVREEGSGALSLIDGAHGIGHLELDLGKLDADFFVSNCHKWLFTPRGCAVLHVPQRNQQLIRSSLPTSHGFIPLPSAPTGDGITPIHSPFPPSGKSPFVTLFEFVGTIDNAPYLCIPAALRFRRDVCGGEDRIREYCTRLAREAGKLVADALGTEVLDNRTGTLTRCCFANVRLPLDVGTDASRGHVLHADVPRVTEYIARVLVDDYNTFIAVMFYAGNWWVRLSAQIYLELKDFEWCVGVLREVCERVRKREYAVEEVVGKARL